MVGRTLNTLVILLDGAADEPIPAFGGKTPLEYLDKKFIDSIASNGDLGWTEGKDYTHLFLLEFLTGRSVNFPRGLVEAVGMGVPIEKDQVAYRFSPVRMADGKIEWLYRVSKEEKKRLQNDIVANLNYSGADGTSSLFLRGRPRGDDRPFTKCHQLPITSSTIVRSDLGPRRVRSFHKSFGTRSGRDDYTSMGRWVGRSVRSPWAIALDEDHDRSI